MRTRKLGRWIAALTAAVVVAATLAACGSGDSAGGDGKSIRIGYFPDISPVSLMQSRHMLEGMGYHVTYIDFLKGVPQEAAAMVSGSVDMVWANASASIAAFSKDPNLAYLVGQVVTNDNQVVARAGSGINSIADLAGKKIATSGEKTAPQLVANLALRKAGKDPSSLQTIQLGGTEQITTMQQKAVEAAATYLPFGAQMALDGGKVLVTADQALGQPFPGGSFVAAKKFADAHPKTVTDVLRAARKATDALRKHTNENFQTLADFAKTSSDSIKYGFDHNLVAFADSQVPNMTALEAVAKAEMQYGFVDKGVDLTSFVQKFVKTSFAEAAAK